MSLLRASRSLLRIALACSLFGLASSACGGAHPGGPAQSATTPRDGKTHSTSGEAGSDKQSLPGTTRVASEKLLDRRSRSGLAADTLGLVKSTYTAPKTDADVYRAVAPATVIIRAGGGLGSGVIIDPDGWVLTNHHVIAQGDTEDFRTKVSVVLGKIDKTGGMARQSKSYDAFVHKDDSLRDIALLKIVDAPTPLPFVRIAKDNPVPGQQVVAVGHAGAGMLWALKAGEISALGKLSEQLATLAQFKDDQREAAQSFKKYLDERNLGLVIQSTCNILPGDSGGPLVTRRGELIGLNAFSNQDPRTGGLLSFHIHRSELAEFVKVKPPKPARLVPDPWKEGGGDASYDDVDLDGHVDALVLEGRRACSFCPRQSIAVFFDVDQDSFKGKSLPPLSRVYEKHEFDAEVAYLQLERDAYVWYDTDDDGRFDFLLYDAGATGRASAAYRIKKDGDLEKDTSLASGRDARPSLLTKSALSSRFQRMAMAAFPEHFVEAGTSTDDALPDPIGHTGNVTVADLDSDGSNDAIRIDSTFSNRLLVDVDRDSVKALPAKFDLASSSARIDAEIAVVTQSAHMWVWYDTDDDGRFDLALHSPGARLYVATDAWHVDAAGKKTPAPENVGRKLVRAELLPASLQASARDIVKKGFLDIMSSPTDSGAASFPDPVLDHRGTSYELLDIKGAHKSVVSVYGQGSDGYLVDLDGHSLASRPTKPKDLAKLVEAGKFHTQFAYFQRNGLAWAYYDTDSKKGYEVVLYSSDPREGKADAGYRIDKSGKVTLDDSLKGKPLVSHSLFKSAEDRKRLQSLGKELFGQRALETP